MIDDAFGDRHHLRIGEVASALGVKTHVLRYWEEEFPSLRPKKTSGAHRHYSREDVTLLARIKELVVDRGFSIAGARRVVEGDRSAFGADGVRGELLLARELLVDLLLDLDADGEPEGLDEGEVGAGGLEPASDDPASVVAARPGVRARMR